MYSAVDLSKYIITKCTEDSHPIANIQLQKILYFIQEQYLRQRSKPLFPEKIEAWQFGPVVPEVYYCFCGFGSMPIIERYSDSSIEPTDNTIVNSVTEDLRELDPWDLVEKTHKPGGAWDRVYNGGKGKGREIPLSFIREDISNELRAVKEGRIQEYTL